uniref:Uncharacterized protein n=1 Tax=Branchiostoma floridae TaxID=7739 RepID=C3YM47_BRAFL|eukprot:XP_002602629.1 hypothetical protein BRAFLDRAFT_81906 [Branchiostoma floridae]
MHSNNKALTLIVPDVITFDPLLTSHFSKVNACQEKNDLDSGISWRQNSSGAYTLPQSIPEQKGDNDNESALSVWAVRRREDAEQQAAAAKLIARGLFSKTPFTKMKTANNWGMCSEGAMSQRSRRSNSVSSQKSDVSERSERRGKSPRSPRSDRKDGSSERESSENFHTECRAGFVAIVGNTKDHIKSRDQLQQGE